MTDYDRLHEIAREDVHTCIEAWKEILSDKDREIEYAYTKGSATKKWDSPIDYVPEISDVDIHVFPTHDGFLNPSNEFADAMKISEMYETLFHDNRQNALHMPRSQIMTISKLEGSVEGYCPPRITDVQILFGNPEQKEIPDIETIRRYDITNLQGLEEFLKPMPMRAVDRAGLDFWYIIRAMTWRVSPSPVRILTQSHEDPFDLWSWNRTRIEQELKNQNYEQIADSYRGFYMSGWDLFLSDFKSLSAYRSVVTHGYNLLKQCLEEGKKFIQS